jgi:hypothetical protein
MADHADDGDGDIFIYRGGRAPQHVTHALIDESVDEIEDDSFRGCKHLLTVETHDGIRRVGACAFQHCESLRRINLKSAIEIDDCAFHNCYSLESVEFGDRLETIGYSAFDKCLSLSLSHLKLPSIITIGVGAFYGCWALSDIELSERLETIETTVFCNCKRLQRIAIPLKRNLFVFCDFYRNYNSFCACEQLTRVDLVGGVHTTVPSLHMESWRTDMIAEINRINQVLPNTRAGEKTNEIKRWMDSVIDKMDHYKAEHYRHVKEGTTLLELALWKAKLDEKDERKTKKVKVDAESARKERRITCGADTVIKNVLPFLQLV